MEQSDIGDGAMPEGMEGLLKQLVWEDVDEICTRCVAPVFGGKMIVVEISPGSGEYSAGIDLGGLCFRLIQDAYDDNGFRYSAPKNFGSIDAAKAAAQSDYTARVLSAVDPDEITRLRAALADAQAVGFAAGVEAAAKRCDAIAGNTADFNHYHRRAAGQCGAAIRALVCPELTAAAARVLLEDDAAMNTLSDYEHRQWAGWFRHQLEQSSPENIERWKRQADTPFALLSDEEKAVDRRFADAALRAIAGDTP